MTCNQNASFDDKQQMTDLLSSQKFLTGVYNTYCCEAATPALKQTLMAIMEDEHRIHGELFSEMSQKGWYTVEKAEETKLNSTKQQFGQKMTV
ncbi:MAG: spore coat protein [Clostridia bacterium]|nr:spore coat protein [Clostridia bacterium]